MLSLVCVVVNDGSVALAEMEGNHVVTKLKETIKEKKMYDFPADELTLFVAKTDGGEWMHLSDDDLAKLQKREKIDAVEALLKKRPMNSATRLDEWSFGFGADDAGEDGTIHVLVEVSAERWEEIRSSKKAKMSAAQLAPPVEFTLKTDSVLVPTDVTEGTLQCTKALSTAFHDFGCFPAAIFVRKEMQMVWTILCDNFIGANAPGVHYALVGSPGVGKSALLLLFCCYLATRHGYWIFFSRSPKGEGGSIAPYVVLWFRGATVTGYPICVPDNIPVLFVDFNAEKMDNKFLIVGDGFREDVMTGSLSVFASCHLLSTSAQFMPKSGDTRELLLLPAWQQDQLVALATAMKIEDVDLRYAYSGGSARDFLRDVPKLQQRLFRTLSRLQRGDLSDSGLGSILRLFAADVADLASYVDDSTWERRVDSSFALQSMAREFALRSVKFLLGIAHDFTNESFYDQLFEVLVHTLAHDKSLELDLRDSQDNFGKASSLRMAADTLVTMGNGDDDFLALSGTQKWAVCLVFLRDHATHKMYWHPGYIDFPAIDSVLILDGVVYYLQMTVADDHDVKWDQMREIHDAVCANPAISSHTFKFVVVIPRGVSWETHKKKTSEIPGMSMGVAHLTNARLEL